MRLPKTCLVIAATVAAAPAWSAAQAQANSSNCTLPPPLVCPPPPPPGPRTVAEVDAYIDGLDATISQNSSAQASSNRPFSSAATSEINEYVGELTRYRGEVADYRDKTWPGGNLDNAVAQEAVTSDPE